MADRQMIRCQVDAIFSEVNYLIRLLYASTDFYTKNLTLNQLWNELAQLHFLIRMMDAETAQLPSPPSAVPPQVGKPGTTAAPAPQQQTLTAFTRQQLAQFNGRNGKPAYVAVNGVVYDVTNNAAWSLATHFGLTAGNDLTQEFASCHAGQQWILRTLQPVGRLVS